MKDRQSLGRLFRAKPQTCVKCYCAGLIPLFGREMLVEKMIASRIQKKILSLAGEPDQTLTFGSATTATGLSLHPYQEKTAKKLLKRLDSPRSSDSISM